MNEKLIVELAALLKTDLSVFKAALEQADGDGNLVKEYHAKHKAFTLDELKKYADNVGTQYMDQNFEEHLTKMVNENKMPQAAYSKLKAVSSDQIGKDLAKELGIEFTNLADLKQRIKEKTDGKGKPDDTLLQQVELLKNTVQEKETALKTLEEKITQEKIATEFSTALNSLPLDFDESAIEKQRKLFASAFNSEHKLVLKEGRLITLGTDGKPVLNKLAEPESLSNIVASFAKAYDFPLKEEDKGGRGTAGSQVTKSKSIKGRAWEDVARESGLQPNTLEMAKLRREYLEENPPVEI